jgi:hypothetical protein
MIEVNRLKRNRSTTTYCGTNMKSEAGATLAQYTLQSPPWHSSQGHPNYQAATHAKCAKDVQVRTQCTNEQYLCSFSNMISHLAIRIPTRQYRTTQQYTDWKQNFGQGQLKLLSRQSAASTACGCRKSTLPSLSPFYAWRDLFVAVGFEF